MLTIGLLPIIVAAGMFEALTLADGITTNFEGVIPKEHCKVAPAVTN